MYPSIETIKAVLLKESYISEKDSAAAEAVSRDSSDYVNYLIREELLSRSLLGQALAESYKLPYIDLENNKSGKELLSLVPEATARDQRVVVVRNNDKFVGLATDNPKGVDPAKLQAIFGKKPVRFGYALPDLVDASLAGYEQPLETRFQRIIEEKKRIAPEIVDEIIKDALRYNVSDIHFEPEADSATVRFRIDGSLRLAGNVPKEYYENILNRIKVESGMRIDEHNTAQDGSIQRSGNGLNVDLRVSLVPTVEGEKVVMRVLGAYVQGFGLQEIGLTDAYRDRLESYATKPFGMILTVGPTGSGKTTTLYSILKLLNKPNVNVTTIEDPVEYRMKGVNQIQVSQERNMTFSRGLRAIVRQDPDVILVGEIRDEETAEISVNAALTGHLLLSTFHANDAATAIPRLIDLGIEPFLLASTLQVIIAQRLVRKLCTTCRYSVKGKVVLAEIKDTTALKGYIAADDNLYAAKGCNACSDTGYQGRVALFEFIDMTPEMQELILTAPSTQEITALARKQGSLPMFEDGISKIKGGLTTLTEVLRVVEPPKLAAKVAGSGKRS